MGELRKIPNVGKQTEKDLIAMGYTTIESLKGKNAERLYEEECALCGFVLDRCQLYLYRAVEYYLNTDDPDPAKLPWWYWKDEYIAPSPCGAVCAECTLFPSECAGCFNIKGKVHWLQYTGQDVCAVYDCCVNDKRQLNCARCEYLPCEKFTLDPTLSDKENRENLTRMINRLKDTL